MKLSILRFVGFGALAFALTVLGTATAQDKAGKDKADAFPEPPPTNDYRQFFKKPKTPDEFWNALQFELDVGRLDLAAFHLYGLLDVKPTDNEMFQLIDRVGLTSVLRLRNIRPWVVVPPFNESIYKAEIDKLTKDRAEVEKIDKVRQQMERAQKAHEDAIKINDRAYKDVERLIEQATQALRKTLTDPERIRKYVRNLQATPEENAFALKELYRSGAAVVPYLLEELQQANAGQRQVILDALRKLGPDILQPLAAALDSADVNLKLDVIDLFQQRAATAQIPYLWFVAASPGEPEPVRKKATEALAYLLNTPESKLPLAKIALTREAERYYQHQVPFSDPKAVTVWHWDGKTVTPKTMPATRAEEYYGLRFAGQALQLDPTYEPAQLTLLSLVLDKGVEQAGLTAPLALANPTVHQLVATANPDLVNKVLERALAEKRLGVIMGATRALGEASEVRATRPTGRGEPPLIRALHYPDRRVQIAAAESVLRTPGTPPPEAAVRVVDILRRSLAAEPARANAAGKVIVGFFDQDQSDKATAAVAKAGFEPIRVRTGREVMRRLQMAADVDLLLLDAELPDPGLASLLGQLRADQNASRLPILLAARPDRVDALRRFVERHANITVIPQALAGEADELAIAFRAKITDPGAVPLSPQESQDYAERAIRYLARMSRGELADFDFRPAATAALDALRSNRLSPDASIAAAEVASRVPGSRAQTELLNAALDGRRQPIPRIAAADLLTRHVQQFGPLLSRDQVQSLRTAQSSAMEPALKARLAVVLGALRPDARTTGERLRDFRPAPPPAPAAPAAPAAPKNDAAP